VRREISNVLLRCVVITAPSSVGERAGCAGPLRNGRRAT